MVNATGRLIVNTWKDGGSDRAGFEYEAGVSWGTPFANHETTRMPNHVHLINDIGHMHGYSMSTGHVELRKVKRHANHTLAGSVGAASSTDSAQLSTFKVSNDLYGPGEQHWSGTTATNSGTPMRYVNVCEPKDATDLLPAEQAIPQILAAYEVAMVRLNQTVANLAGRLSALESCNSASDSTIPRKNTLVESIINKNVHGVAIPTNVCLTPTDTGVRLGGNFKSCTKTDTCNWPTGYGIMEEVHICHPDPSFHHVFVFLMVVVFLIIYAPTQCQL